MLLFSWIGLAGKFPGYFCFLVFPGLNGFDDHNSRGQLILPQFQSSREGVVHGTTVG